MDKLILISEENKWIMTDTALAFAIGLRLLIIKRKEGCEAAIT